MIRSKLSGCWQRVLGACLCGLMVASGPESAAAGDPVVAAGISPEAAAILDDVLPEEAYLVTEHCISTRRVRRVDVLDEQHVLFETRREAWLSRLPMNCRGMRPGHILVFDQTGSQLCQHDRMTAREPGIAANEDFPPRCRLGRFERIEREQAGMLREQFKHLRKQRR